jgi:fructose-1,6-bisphosphatase
MSNPVLRKAVENEFKRMIESLLYQSSENECFEDYLLDLEYYGSVKTLKKYVNAMGKTIEK